MGVGPPVGVEQGHRAQQLTGVARQQADGVGVGGDENRRVREGAALGHRGHPPGPVAVPLPQGVAHQLRSVSGVERGDLSRQLTARIVGAHPNCWHDPVHNALTFGVGTRRRETPTRSGHRTSVDLLDVRFGSGMTDGEHALNITSPAAFAELIERTGTPKDLAGPDTRLDLERFVTVSTALAMSCSVPRAEHRTRPAAAAGALTTLHCGGTPPAEVDRQAMGR